MNDEIKLKLQAYLDGELSGRDKAEVATLLAQGGEAQLWFSELQFVKSALRDNELQLKVPETREFYWSKIEREISRESVAPERAPRASVLGWWKPVYFRLAGGVAAACALLLISFVAFNNGNSVYYPGEVEGNGDEMGAITYHSDAEQMTVVYLFDRDSGKAANPGSN